MAAVVPCLGSSEKHCIGLKVTIHKTCVGYLQKEKENLDAWSVRVLLFSVAFIQADFMLQSFPVASRDVATNFVLPRVGLSRLTAKTHGGRLPPSPPFLVHHS
jgi:hypothetical protein